MKLKLDENLGTRGAELFRQAGHDIFTLHNKASVPRPTKIYWKLAEQRKVSYHVGPGIREPFDL